MRIAALSDLHIGARPWMDEFRHSERSFVRFLDRLEAEFEAIVLVGDIFQTDHCWIPGRHGRIRQFRLAQRRLPALTKRFAAAPYHYIYGNHDAIADELLAAPETHEIEADGLRVFFVHGHQYDPLFRRAETLTRAASWFTGRLRFVGLRALAQRVEGHDIRIKHRRFHRDSGPYLSAGRLLLQKQRADVVVMGHTHVPVRVEMPEGIVVNSGSCSAGQLSYVAIDTLRRSVELRRG